MDTINSKKFEVIVEEELHIIKLPRLDRWLAKKIESNPRLPDLSRTRLKQLILDGFVTQNGETIRDPSTIVKHLQKYIIVIPEASPALPLPETIDLKIVYEDTHLLVIDKPADMVVHPAPGALRGTLVNALLAHCGDSLSGIGGVKRPGIVHRLDKDTTGLIVVAKTDEAHHNLVHQFASRLIRRTYTALIWGSPFKNSFQINAPIGRSRRNRKKMAVVNNGGKSAVTNIETLERFGTSATLIKCRLETGRTHQIRVHACHIGHPIIGDPVYGSGKIREGINDEQRIIIKSLRRQALHAGNLSFKHPKSQEICCFKSQLPQDMQSLTNAFRAQFS